MIFFFIVMFKIQLVNANIYFFFLNWIKCEINLKRREIGFFRYGKLTFIRDSQEIILVCDV